MTSLRTAVYYAPTFFIDQGRSALGSDRPGSCVLLVRTYEARGSKGSFTTSVWTFDGEDSLARYVMTHPELRELPAEADGDPGFVPAEVAGWAKSWLRRPPDARDDRVFNVCICTYHRWKPVEWNEACPLHGEGGTLVQSAAEGRSA